MAIAEPRGKRLVGSARWSALWGLGMLLVFVGERAVGTGHARAVSTVAGLLAVLGALAVRLLRARGAEPDQRRVENTLAQLYAIGVVALVIYFVQSDVLPTLRGGKALELTSPFLATALAALWPAIWLAGAFPVLLVEMAVAQMAKAPRLETGRVRDAMLSGLGVAFALVFAFAAAYVASERDPKVDLAYFRTTRPGEVTRKIVRNLDKPIEVAIFFPSGNDVREQVDEYFKDLGKESGQLTVSHYDFDINPVKAKELGVSTNGILVFVRGGRHEQLGLQTNMEQARNALRTLDKEVQQRLMMVVKPTKTVMITQGHGERSWEATTDTEKRPGIKTLRDMLIDQSYDVRYIGAGDGLGQEIPKDAGVVMVIGPQKPFLPEESAALNRYIERGGRVLIALDPENHVNMKEILEPLMLEYHDVTLASDMAFFMKSHQDSDHAILGGASFSSHPSVTTLARLGMRAPLVLPGTGWINTRRDRPKDVVVDSPIKAHFSTYEDKNGNFHQDPGEQKRAWEVGATAVKKDARVFVLGDSDCLADEAIRAPGNQILAMDVTHWLMGDEAYSGIVSSEADVPITHTRKQDTVWFYSTIVLGPLAVIGLGFGVTRRGRRKRASAPPAAPAQGGAS
jgi:hypothetical protein